MIRPAPHIRQEFPNKLWNWGDRLTGGRSGSVGRFATRTAVNRPLRKSGLPRTLDKSRNHAPIFRLASLRISPPTTSCRPLVYRAPTASFRTPSFMPHSVADRLLRNLNNGFFDGARPRSDPSGGVAYPWPRRPGRPLALRCRARVLVPRICFGHRTRAPCAPLFLRTRQLVRNDSHTMLAPCSSWRPPRASISTALLVPSPRSQNPPLRIHQPRLAGSCRSQAARARILEHLSAPPCGVVLRTLPALGIVVEREIPFVLSSLALLPTRPMRLALALRCRARRCRYRAIRQSGLVPLQR